MPASTSPRAIFPDKGEPAVSNRAGGACQDHLGTSAVSVRLVRSSNNPQQGGVSSFLSHHPTIPPFPDFAAAGRGPATAATSGETSTTFAAGATADGSAAIRGSHVVVNSDGNNNFTTQSTVLHGAAQALRQHQHEATAFTACLTMYLATNPQQLERSRGHRQRDQRQQLQ